MTIASEKFPLWSPEEKTFVEELHFDKWSPSGIAMRVFEEFGTDRTRHQVEDLIRVSSVINQNVMIEPSQRRFIPRREAIERFSLPAPMAEIVPSVPEPLVSDDAAQRIVELWREGLSVDAIAAQLDLPVEAVLVILRRIPGNGRVRIQKAATHKTLVELETCECRFPVWREKDETFFCAAVVAPEDWSRGTITGSYCAHHARIASPAESRKAGAA